MSSYFLIHSSGHGPDGPDGWNLLVQELERRGHGVLTPAMRVDRTYEGLAWHAETLVEALERSSYQPQEVVCVAHSASGMYLPLVAERWPPRRMVFLAAIIPRPGLSMMDQYRADPSMFNPAWIGKNPMDDEVALEFTLHDCPTERLDWALSTRQLFYAKRAMEEPCPLTTWPAVPAASIVCSDDRTITPAWQWRAAREYLGVEPFELPGGTLSECQPTRGPRRRTGADRVTENHRPWLMQVLARDNSGGPATTLTGCLRGADLPPAYSVGTGERRV